MTATLARPTFPTPPAGLPVRLLLLALALVAAGCDSAGDPEVYDGVIEVSLTSVPDAGSGLRLVAVDDAGCDRPLRVETEIVTEADPERVRIRVLGIVPPVGGECEALIPASAVVPSPFTRQGEFPVEITHAGATDAYGYVIGGTAGDVLRAVRTSTTRLAAP